MDDHFRFPPPLPLEASLAWNQMITKENPWRNPQMPSSMKNPTSNHHLLLRGQSLYFKTRMCLRFRSGHCPNGDSCNFAHSIEELRSPFSNGVADRASLPRQDYCYSSHRQNPNIPNGYGSLQEDTSGGHDVSFRQNSVHRKTRLCYRWSAYGRCMYGDKCNHAHGDAELRKVGLDHCEVDGKSIATAPSKVSPSLFDDVLPKVKSQPISLSQPPSRIKTLTLEKCKRIYGDWIDD